MSNLILFFVFSGFNMIQVPHDADRKSNGNTLITTITFGEMLVHVNRREIQDPMEVNNLQHKLIEIDPTGKVVWSFLGLAIPHEVAELPNGHLLVADTQFDRIIEIDYPEKNIIWSWEPGLINWTKVNPNWGTDHYYNNPIVYDWTHVNDVDFKQYGTWNACLISLRNFDLVVEVNYSADFNDPNNPDNIVWWYGDFENYTYQRKQHNPGYLANGNIVVSDSGNDRIIEVNYTSKEIIWNYDENLNWPRDADELENGNFLITDSNGCKVIEVTKSTKQIVWSYSFVLLIPYEADALENGNILISTAYDGLVIEVNRDGVIVWSHGFSYITSFIFINCILIIVLSSAVLYYKYQYLKNIKRFTQKKKIVNITIVSLFILLIILGILLIIFYNQLITVMVDTVYSLGGVDLY